MPDAPQEPPEPAAPTPEQIAPTLAVRVEADREAMYPKPEPLPLAPALDEEDDAA
jgi:hypothetical protein